MFSQKEILVEIKANGYETFLKKAGQHLMNCSEDNSIQSEFNTLFNQLSSIYFEGSGLIPEYPRPYIILAKLLNGAIDKEYGYDSTRLNLWISTFNNQPWFENVWQEEFVTTLSPHLQDFFHELYESHNRISMRM